MELNRNWKVFLIHHTHTDIGFTDYQPRVFEEHLDYLDKVIEFCERTENEPEEQRFRWACEVAWQIEHYYQNRPHSQFQKLVHFVKSGQIEVCALHVNFTELLDVEMLARSFYPVMKLSREYGFPVRTAMASDINGLAWGLAKMLPSLGVKFLDMASNPTRALRRMPPHFFWWEANDGSRVLVWDGEVYTMGNIMGISSGVEEIEANLLPYLQGLDEKGYPYDCLALRVQGGFVDNAPPRIELLDDIRNWNDQHGNPHIELVTPSQWFDYACRHLPLDAIRVVHGAWPDPWSDGLGSAPKEVALQREVQRQLLRDEAAAAVDKVESKSAGDGHSGELVRDLIFFGEHTFGDSMSVIKPDDAMSRRQWEYKRGFINHAAKLVNLKSPDDDLASEQLAWKELNLDNPLHLATPYYKLVFCPATGSVIHLRDIELNADLLDPLATYQLNQLIFERVVSPRGRGDLWDSDYESPETPHEFWVVNRERSRIRRSAEFQRTTPVVENAAFADTPDAAYFRVRGTIGSIDSYESIIRIFKAEKRIDFEHRLHRRKHLEPNALYVAFPFAARLSEGILLDAPGGAFHPGREQVPLSSMDWYCINNWAAVGIGGNSVYWVSLDAPLVQLGDFHSGSWSEAFDESQPATLYSWASNNYWYTNFPGVQDGDMKFRYSLTSRTGSPDRTAAEAFAAEVAGADQVQSFLPVTWMHPGVRLRCFKRACNGKGSILRIEEVGGKSSSVNLSFRKDITSVQETDLVEQKVLADLKINEGNCSVSFRPGELKTLLLRAE